MINILLRQKLSVPQLRKMLLVICLTLPIVTQAVTVGEPAPFFELLDIKQNTVSSNDLKGKVMFVNFWASWCAPCRKELPMLDQLQSRHEDLIVVAINIDEDRNNAQRFLDKYKISSLVLFDPQTSVITRYGAVAMPTSYVLDKKGVVRFSHFGFDEKKDPAKWDEEISGLLREAP